MITLDDLAIMDDWDWEPMDSNYKISKYNETQFVKFEQESWATTQRNGNRLTINYPEFDTAKDTKLMIPFNHWQDAQKFYEQIRSCEQIDGFQMKIYKPGLTQSILDMSNEGNPVYIVEICLLKNLWEEFMQTNRSSDYFFWNLCVPYES